MQDYLIVVKLISIYAIMAGIVIGVSVFIVSRISIYRIPRQETEAQIKPKMMITDTKYNSYIITTEQFNVKTIEEGQPCQYFQY